MYYKKKNASNKKTNRRKECLKQELDMLYYVEANKGALI
jgi:hypothetical protein